jgi:hypothetical protein
MREAIVVDEQGRINVPRLWAADAAAGVSVHVIITAGEQRCGLRRHAFR